VFAKILTVLAEELRELGGIDLREGFIDGTFAPAKRGRWRGQDQCGKGTKTMGLADAQDLPLVIDVSIARPHEVTLVGATFDAYSRTNSRKL
jgi:hypothetical protein